MCGQVPGPGVAQRDGRVLAAPGEQQAERAADRDAAPDHGDVRARDRDVVAPQQLHDAPWRAGQRSRLAEHQLAQVDRVQPVGVLGRVHPVQDGEGVQASWQRQLDQVPGALGVGVQFVDDRLDPLLGGAGGQVTADAGDAGRQAVAVLAVDVGVAARVVPHQYRAQPGYLAHRGQVGHPFPEVLLDCGGGGAAVENRRRHRVLPIFLLNEMLIVPSRRRRAGPGDQWKKCLVPVK